LAHSLLAGAFPARAGALVSTAEQIRAGSVLPARREPFSVVTQDGLRLIGEIALPLNHSAVATCICVHPLPTHGGMMDSHVLRKASWRLPALADIAVVRFNTRGTTSAAGTSEGTFDEARGEGLDLAAVIAEVVARGLPAPWLVGWSFGTDVVLKHGNVEPVQGAFLLSPPLRFTSEAELLAWDGSPRPVIALVPEHDDYLPPDAARERFAPVSSVQVVAVDDAKHLWVGERYVRIVLDEVVRVLNPQAWPLPSEWSGERAAAQGPMEIWSDL
jgi:alpha/beta superfamily hydrolase